MDKDDRYAVKRELISFENTASIVAIVRLVMMIVSAIAFQTLKVNGAKYASHLIAIVSGLLMYTRHLNTERSYSIFLAMDGFHHESSNLMYLVE